MKKLFSLALVLTILSSNVFAANDMLDDETLDDEAIIEEVQTEFTEEMRKQIGDDAVRNILKPTRVTCFKIAQKSKMYTGETLNGYALIGTCGNLTGKAADLITKEFFINENNVEFEKKENCMMHPEYIIRYSYGFDNVDVLVSVPCYALMVTYAGRNRIFNFKPGAEFLTQIDAIFGKKVKTIGTSRNKGPVRKWENKGKKKDGDPKAKKEEKAPVSGWNNLNYGFGKK